MSIVVTKDLGFSYPGGSPALSEINLTLEAGKLTCVLGPNGSGKSTLLKLMGGLLKTQAGTLTTLDCEPAKEKRHLLARRLAFLPQQVHVSFPFSVEEVVLMGRYARATGYFENHEDRELAREALALCDLQQYAQRRFDQLSGGERRRVLLAQALCQQVELLLLDEPTASLDPAHAIEFFHVLKKQLGDSLSAVVVTHDLNLAARFADHVVVLSEGRMIIEGTAASVLASKEAAQTFACTLHTGTLPNSDTPFVVAF